MNEPILDRAVFDDLIESIGEDGARTVLGLFIDESSTYLGTISAAVAQSGDAGLRDKARRAAHSYKSGAGQVGAAAVAAAAAAVEAAAAAGGAEFLQCVAALERRTQEAVAALTPLLRD